MTQPPGGAAALAAMQQQMQQLVQQAQAQTTHVDGINRSASSWQTVQTNLDDLQNMFTTRAQEMQPHWRDDAGQLFGQRMQASSNSAFRWAETMRAANAGQALQTLSGQITATNSNVQRSQQQFNQAIQQNPLAAATHPETLQHFVDDAQRQLQELDTHFGAAAAKVRSAANGSAFDGPKDTMGERPPGAAPAGGPAGAPAGGGAGAPAGAAAAGGGGGAAGAGAGGGGGAGAGAGAGGAGGAADGGGGAGASAGSGGDPSLAGGMMAPPMPQMPTAPQMPMPAGPAASGGMPFIPPMIGGAGGVPKFRAPNLPPMQSGRIAPGGGDDGGGGGGGGGTGRVGGVPGVIGSSGVGAVGGKSIPRAAAPQTGQQSPAEVSRPPANGAAAEGGAQAGAAGGPQGARPMMPPMSGMGAGMGAGSGGGGGTPRPGVPEIGGSSHRSRPAKQVPGVPSKLRGRAGDDKPAFLAPAGRQNKPQDESDNGTVQLLDEELWQVDDAPAPAVADHRRMLR